MLAFINDSSNTQPFMHFCMEHDQAIKVKTDKNINQLARYTKLSNIYEHCDKVI